MGALPTAAFTPQARLWASWVSRTDSKAVVLKPGGKGASGPFQVSGGQDPQSSGRDPFSIPAHPGSHALPCLFSQQPSPGASSSPTSSPHRHCAPVFLGLHSLSRCLWGPFSLVIFCLWSRAGPGHSGRNPAWGSLGRVGDVSQSSHSVGFGKHTFRRRDAGNRRGGLTQVEAVEILQHRGRKLCTEHMVFMPSTSCCCFMAPLENIWGR